MKCKSFICFLFVTATLVRAAPVFMVAQNDTRTLLLETDSVHRLGMGAFDFTTKTVSSRGYRPEGATETIAIALTDYEMDCWRGRVKETGIRYLTDENKDAGRAPEVDRAWTSIEPGSDLDVVHKKIC